MHKQMTVGAAHWSVFPSYLWFRCRGFLVYFEALLDLTVSSSTSPRAAHADAWDGEADEANKTPVKRLSKEQAQALATSDTHPVRPWRVVGAQAAVGLVVALVCGAVTGSMAGFWSALYGAGVVVVPAALMARGMTSPLSSMSPLASAMSLTVIHSITLMALARGDMLLKGLVMLGVALMMLGLAPKVVQPLVWPALLAALVVCIKVYWVALAWRRKN
jgi:ATP synthase protein I